MKTKQRKQPIYGLQEQRCKTMESLLINIKHLLQENRQIAIVKQDDEYVINYNLGPSK